MNVIFKRLLGDQFDELYKPLVVEPRCKQEVQVQILESAQELLTLVTFEEVILVHAVVRNVAIIIPPDGPRVAELGDVIPLLCCSALTQEVQGTEHR